jgi:hypothetical protein
MGWRAVAVAVFLATCPAGAAAAPVVVLGPGDRASTRNDPYLTRVPLIPLPAAGGAPRAARSPAKPAVATALARLERTGAITAAGYRSYSARYGAAVSAVRRLRGVRARELGAVIANLNTMAVAGSLTPPRLPVLFLSLDRNRQWWTSGPLLGTYQRVEFAGSQLVWEYYPGQGIELQVLGSFGEADGLYTAGRAQYPSLLSLLGELIPLAVPRAGGIAWEYYFNFDGGMPPWTSAMSQGTALQSLADAFEVTGQRSYLRLGHSALALFGAPPPAGVRIPTALGARYVQYTFAPGIDIINAFLQSLIGLDQFARVSGDAQAAALFAAGDAEARAEVPRFDTGAWSLYQPGVEDDLSYHQLVTGFLQQLCSLTRASVYCTTAERFTAYLHTPPALTLITRRARRGKPFALRFGLSKRSHVGVVLTRGSQTMLATSADFGYGVDAFRVPAVRRPGVYSVRLAATDLAGNFARIAGTVRVA